MLDFAVEPATTPFLGLATSHRELYNDEGGGNENVIKVIDLSSKTTTFHVPHAFLYISLPSLHNYDVKVLCYTRRFATTSIFSATQRCNIVSNSYNIVPTLQCCVALEIVVANRPV